MYPTLLFRVVSNSFPSITYYIVWFLLIIQKNKDHRLNAQLSLTSLISSYYTSVNYNSTEFFGSNSVKQEN